MEKLFSEVKLYYSTDKYILLDIQEISINYSNDTLTDTCSIVISKVDTYSNSTLINIKDTDFNLGSKVEITLGYIDIDNSKLVFTGYLTGFRNNNDTMLLTFDDSMYLLKNSKRVKKSFPSGLTLENIVDDIIGASVGKIETSKIEDRRVMDIDAGTITLNNYLLPSEILQMLKERFGIYCYFKNNVLYVGHRYWKTYEETYKITDKSKTYQFKYPNTTQKPYHKILDISNLDYTVIDKNQYMVKGNSVYNFSAITYSYPEDIQDPLNVSTISLPDTDLNSLKKLVKDAYENLNYGGFQGSIEFFGYPFLYHGDIIELEIDLSHVKDSPRVVKEKYFIDENVVTFGSNGFKQSIKIGNQKL